MLTKIFGSIQNKLYSIILAFFLFMFVAVGLTWNTIDNQKLDGKVINIAGKQRMLSQKMTKEFLASILFYGEQQAFYMKNLTNTAKLFDSSLNNLINGNEELEIPATKDEEILEQMNKVKKIWGNFYSHIKVMTDSDASAQKKQEALVYIEGNNVTLLTEMNKAVGMYEAVSTKASKTLIDILAVLIVLTVIIAIIVAWGVKVLIVKPIDKTVDSIVTLSTGDLSVRLEKTKETELDELVMAINKFVENLSSSILSIKKEGETVFASANNLYDFSTELANSAEEEKEQSATIATSVEEISINVSTIAATAEQMSTNASVVASNTEKVRDDSNSVKIAVEEMNNSMTNVLGHANGASNIAHEAIKLSQKGNSSMNLLGEAANEIGKVTDVIKRIAEQTNLLALNATIEAASAGEAGKGFAVVANEIKELASQSAKAAEDIAERITGVQTNTKEAVSVIGDVSNVINKINDSIEEISSAINIQSDAARSIVGRLENTQSNLDQIVNNISEVNVGTNELAKSTSESSTGVNEVARSISILSETSAKNMTGVMELKSTSENFRQISEKLIHVVQEFKFGS